MGNLINSRLAFIELIKILYQIFVQMDKMSIETTVKD